MEDNVPFGTVISAVLSNPATASENTIVTVDVSPEINAVSIIVNEVTVIVELAFVITNSSEVASLKIYPLVLVIVAVTEYVPNASALGISRYQSSLITTSPFDALYKTLFTTTVRVSSANRVAAPVILGVVSEIVWDTTVTGPLGFNVIVVAKYSFNVDNKPLVAALPDTLVLSTKENVEAINLKPKLLVVLMV